MSYQTVVALMLLLPAAALVNSWIFSNELKRFMAQVPCIETHLDLDRFKQVVARQMYAALLQIVLLGSPLLLCVYAFATKIFSPPDALYLVIPSLIVGGAAMAMKSVETRAKSIPVANPELEPERRRIVHTWDKKPFPDW